jgi:thiamine pyrophosphate-dependent acetolactate synthase large subunit-like protein
MSTVQDVTKNRWEVRDARGIPMAVRRAFKEALTMPTGPVYLAFSGDALDAKEVDGVIRRVEPVASPGVASSSTLGAIHDALLNAEAPLLVVGPDVAHAGAQRELLELVENYALPVAINFFDYASFPPTHPHHVGMVDGVPDDRHDVVCCIGYRPNTRADATDERFPDAFKIGIGHDPAMLGNTFALDVHLWSDVQQALTALNALWNPADANLHHLSKRRGELVDSGAARIAAREATVQARNGENPIHQTTSATAWVLVWPRARWWSPRISAHPISSCRSASKTTIGSWCARMAEVWATVWEVLSERNSRVRTDLWYSASATVR